MTALECQRYLPLVVDLAEGTLAAADRGRVEAHVAGCAECRDALDAVREAPDILGISGGPPAPDDAFFAAQRRNVMRNVGLIDDALARERRTGRWRTAVTALAASVLAAIGVRWTMLPPPGTTPHAGMQLARAELVQTFTGPDGLLADGDLDGDDPLNDEDIEALDDFLGTV